MNDLRHIFWVEVTVPTGKELRIRGTQFVEGSSVPTGLYFLSYFSSFYPTTCWRGKSYTDDKPNDRHFEVLGKLILQNIKFYVIGGDPHFLTPS